MEPPEKGRLHRVAMLRSSQVCSALRAALAPREHHFAALAHFPKLYFILFLRQEYSF